MDKKSGKTQASSAEGDQNWSDLYHQAFAQFGSRALWNMRELEKPTPDDALAAARQLRVEGDLKARKFAERLERFARADL
jgi:hypothetical protein